MQENALDVSTDQTGASASTFEDSNAHASDSGFEETADLVMRKIHRNRRNASGTIIPVGSRLLVVIVEILVA